MKITISIFFSLLNYMAIGQALSEGFVKDSNTNENLSFVNVGIVDKNVGTVADSAGYFKIAIEKSFDNDSVRISFVGYKTKTIKVIEFKEALLKDKVIFLQQETTQLKEITVRSHHLKEKILGNRSESKKFRGGFSKSALGNELGIIIKVGRDPVYVKRFNTFILFESTTTSDSMKFRLNFYDLKDGFPNNKIVNEQIIFPIKTKDGKFTFDLSKYDIVMNQDFFLSLELVENYGKSEKKGILFSARLFGSSFITRETSQGKWTKIPVISLGFNITVER